MINNYVQQSLVTSEGHWEGGLRGTLRVLFRDAFQESFPLEGDDLPHGEQHHQ